MNKRLPPFPRGVKSQLIPGRSPDLRAEFEDVELPTLRLPRFEIEWPLKNLSRLQWRDHAGLAPASLLCPRGHPGLLTSRKRLTLLKFLSRKRTLLTSLLDFSWSRNFKLSLSQLGLYFLFSVFAPAEANFAGSKFAAFRFAAC
jgi:hypothetical protein